MKFIEKLILRETLRSVHFFLKDVVNSFSIHANIVAHVEGACDSGISQPEEGAVFARLRLIIENLPKIFAFEVAVILVQHLFLFIIIAHLALIGNLVIKDCGACALFHALLGCGIDVVEIMDALTRHGPLVKVLVLRTNLVLQNAGRLVVQHVGLAGTQRALKRHQIPLSILFARKKGNQGHVN